MKRIEDRTTKGDDPPSPASAKSPARKSTSTFDKLLRLWLLLCFSLFGATFLASSGNTAFLTYRFLQTAVEVPGEVVELQRRPSRRGTVVYAVARYVDHSGQARTVTSTTATSEPSFHLNESVRVLYDPADPARPHGALIHTWMELWFGLLITTLIGTLFSGAAVLLWRYSSPRPRRTRRKRP
jgi:hypothetical protein